VGTLNETLAAAKLTLTNLNDGVTSLNQVLAARGTQRLTGDLSDTLVELRSVLDGFSQDAELYQDLNSSLSSLDQTLESLNRLAKELADKPSSVIFSAPRKDDPIPEARP
jgi:paraquat-inducible protein B